ncbi:MAG TPA: MmcQ/YjbR family DNA-binding protein [Longimicrobium sp.]|nr:MmcQ/YjbR family DNA-binding protein [Longimicrobium sp.]
MSTPPAEERGVTWAQLRDYVLTLPGVEEGTSYGTPAFRVKGKFFLRLWEDGQTLVLKTDFYERDHLIGSEPETFFTTDHYAGYPSVLVRLPAVRPGHLRALLLDSWRRHAPAKLVRAYDETR